MVLLLARCWEYKLKTEDVLELTQVRRGKHIVINNCKPKSNKSFVLQCYPGKSSHRIVYRSRPARRRRDLHHNIEATPKARTGQTRSMGTRTGRAKVNSLTDSLTSSQYDSLNAGF